MAVEQALLALIGAADVGGAYRISRSLRFNSADSAYLSRTPGSAGNRKTWTWSGWVKRSAINSRYSLFVAATGGNNQTEFFFEQATGADTLHFYHYDNAYLGQCRTVAVFRDTSAWYHIVLAVDTTQATASNRCKIYVNGVQQDTTFTTNFTQNADLYVNATNAHAIGYDVGNAPSQPYYFSGYLANVEFVDGSALTPSSFAETDATTAQWIPKLYSGSYGTNGFKLTFADNSAATASTLGKDTSGNSNNWTPNNLSVTAGAGNDSLVDTPTSVSATDTGIGGEIRGNYCTWNPLTGAITLTNGNLDGNSTGAAWRGATGTTGVFSGKWYWESTIQNTDSGNYYGEFGFIKTTDIASAITVPSSINGITYYARNGRKFSGGTSVVTSSSGATTGDIVQVAVDLDAGKIWFGVNNTWIDSGNPASGTNAAYTGLSGTYLPVVGVFDGGTCNTNFGQRAFAYTAPAGFSPLVDTLLPTPTIAKPNTVMDTVLYTGTGASLTPTSTLGFSPDLVWIKSRSAATDHALYDTVRGVTKDIASNLTTAETTQAQGVTAFNSNGFTVGTLAKLNTNAATYAGWCWDGGTSTVTNTSGTISSQVRANASAGFSIVTATYGTNVNETIGHGLGVAPEFIISKNRDTASSWYCYHKALGINQYIILNNTDAAATLSGSWGTAAPTSTVFGARSGLAFSNTRNTVCYVFAPVANYSAFGSYTGNGSSDGPFVYTGFRPRWVMIKASSSTGDWYIIDTSRDTYNLSGKSLQANTSNAEPSVGGPFSMTEDILSNGFKLRDGGSGSNGSSVTYVYAAFAENPFQYARAR